jgi:hypothetical protein
LLAESMDARGYGRGEDVGSSRALSWAGLGLLLGAVALWISGRPSEATAAAIAGGGSLVWGFRVAAVRATTSRLLLRAVGAFDIAVITASVVATVASILAGADAAYDAYPVVSWPSFSLPTAAITLTFVLPALPTARVREVAA